MKAIINDKFVCLNPEILQPYYDSKYTGEVLTITNNKVPKVVNRSGGSNYFAIFESFTKTKIGHDNRFCASMDVITTKNFKRV